MSKLPMHNITMVRQAADCHIVQSAIVYLIVNSILRQLVQRIQVGITLKRETITAWDALPVRMKLHTPAQQVTISNNRKY